MSGLIDWESCNARSGRACHRACGKSRDTTRPRLEYRSDRARVKNRRHPALAEFAILRPVFRSARPSAAQIRCRRSARR